VLFILISVYLLKISAAIDQELPVANIYSKQTLLVVNLRFSDQAKLVKKSESLPNLDKYFLREGVRIDIAAKSLDVQGKNSPGWLLNDWLNNYKIGMLGRLINSEKNISTLKKSINFSADLKNLVDWRERIDTLVKWISDSETSERTNFGLLNLPVGYEINDYGLIIGYLIQSLIKARRLNSTNIILYIEATSDTLVFARGPIFKRNLVANKDLGIDTADIYKLICFVVGLDYDESLPENIQVIVEDDFLRERMAEIESVNYFYHIKHFLPGYEKFQRERHANESYLRDLYNRIGLKERLTAVKNEVYVFMLLIIMMFFLVVVQLNHYNYSIDYKV